MTDIAQKEDFVRNIDRMNMNSRIIETQEIYPSDFNPRKHFDTEALNELVESILEHGLIEPIVVRERTAGGYEIIAGERRWRACRMAGMENIPAIVRKADDSQARVLALVENLVRRDINPVEEAMGFQALRDMGLQVQEIAQKVNRAQSTISNSMRLLELDDSVLKSVSSGDITQSHARALVPFAGNKALTDVLVDGITTHKITSKSIETLKVADMPYQVGSAIRKHVGELGSYECKFSPEEVCKGCGNRMARFCLDKDCYSRNNKEVLAAKQAEFLAAQEAAGDGLVNVNDYIGLWDWVNKERLGCDPDCPHLKQMRYGNNELRDICINKFCLNERRELADARVDAERAAAKEEQLARTLHAIYNDPDAAHKMNVIAVIGSIRRASSNLFDKMEDVSKRHGLFIDFAELRKHGAKTYNDDSLRKTLDALCAIPVEHLDYILAQAELLIELDSYGKNVLNDWLCGVQEEEAKNE